MGLFDLFRKKEQPAQTIESNPEPSYESVVVDAALRQSLAELEQEAHNEHIRKVMGDAYKPPYMAEIDAPFGHPPFPDGMYVCEPFVDYDEGTGSAYESGCRYLANEAALKLFIDDLSKVEDLIDGEALGIPSLPPMRTDYDVLKPYNEPPSETPWNCVSLSVKPLTPTGKKPLYITEVTFSTILQPTYEEYKSGVVYDNGVIADLCYLDNGEVGKAVLRYNKDGAQHAVHFKTVDGSLVVSRITYLPNPFAEPIHIYRA